MVETTRELSARGLSGGRFLRRIMRIVGLDGACHNTLLEGQFQATGSRTTRNDGGSFAASYGRQQ